jgi:hypothetical protein
VVRFVSVKSKATGVMSAIATVQSCPGAAPCTSGSCRSSG